MADCVSLMVASGRGERFGGALPKQYQPLAGRPVLRHCLRAFAGHPRVDAVRAVIHPDDRALYDEAAQGLALLEPAHGGADAAGVGPARPGEPGGRCRPSWC